MLIIHIKVRIKLYLQQQLVEHIQQFTRLTHTNIYIYIIQIAPWISPVLFDISHAGSNDDSDTLRQDFRKATPA